MLFEKIKLEDDEKLLLVVRRHWFVFLTRILGAVVSTIAPFLIITITLAFPATAPYAAELIAVFTKEILFFSAAWLLINWMILAYIWTDHYLDLWVVTDRRIISIDQRALFVRSISSFRLERLQDMNIVIPGFLATMFNFGTIEAQTASASDDEFTVDGLPAPREIKAIVLEATDRRMGIGDVSITTSSGI